MHPEKNTFFGLSEQEVQRKKEEGLVNHSNTICTKTYGQILKENLLTLFNAINLFLAVCVISVGEYKNALFILLVIANALTGVVQEIRAKKRIEKLSILTAPKACVIREGERKTIEVEELVMGDLIELYSGQQIGADAVIEDGIIEIDESLLTGESDPVFKKRGEHVYSGSIVVGGSCIATVERVGTDGYAEKIIRGAKKYKKTDSKIIQSIKIIIRSVTVVILPTGVLLFLKQFFLMKESLNSSIVSSVAALIGMIPQGMVLLVSIVFAVGVIRLAQKKTLVRELYGIETLARVDVICMDKTGTLTEGNMCVEKVVPIAPYTQGLIDQAICALSVSLKDHTSSLKAIQAYAKGDTDWKEKEVMSFSSERKWSGVCFFETGCFFLGAGEALLKEKDSSVRKMLQEYEAQGYRTMLLAKKKGEELTPDFLEPMAIVLLADSIRKEAPEILRFFEKEEVIVKIISGDSALLAHKVALKAGVHQAEKWIDVFGMEKDELKKIAGQYTVFGRVSPEQKRILVEALQENGHTVAMTGDGVNDVLALRSADVSIAVASGSDAARCASGIVLMDSNLSVLYDVVMEGRRGINNLERSASLFLVKTTFSLILSILFVFIPAVYPFIPIQLTLISSLCVGIPSFLLAFSQDKRRVQGEFLKNILKKALPGGFVIALNSLLLAVVGKMLGFSQFQIYTVLTVITGYTSFLILANVMRPMKKSRVVMLFILVIVFALIIAFYGEFFKLCAFNTQMILCAGVMGVAVPFLLLAFRNIAEKIMERLIKLKRKG